MKTCSKCKIEFPYTAFYPNPHRKDGHDYVCKECSKAAAKFSYAKRKDSEREKRRQRYNANPEQKARYYLDNRDIILEKTKNRRRSHPDKYRAIDAAKDKRIQQATPGWVDASALQLIYQNRPEGHHVDHVIPLRGKNVCGLHVPWNLQYLPAVDNIKKSNKFSG